MLIFSLFFHFNHEKRSNRQFSQCVIVFNKGHTIDKLWKSPFQLFYCTELRHKFHSWFPLLHEVISKVLCVRISYMCWWNLQGVHSHSDCGQCDTQSHGELHDVWRRERGSGEAAIRLVPCCYCDTQHFLQVIKNLGKQVREMVSGTVLNSQIHFLFLNGLFLVTLLSDNTLPVSAVNLNLLCNPSFLTWMLNSKADTASSSISALPFSVSSMLFIRLLYSCLKRFGLVTPGKEKNESPSLLLSPRDFWVIFPNTWPPDRSPRYRV